MAPIVVKFLALWLISVVVIAGVALLTDINWTRRYMQKALAETLHRDVRLGRLTWSFGLNGLAIDTTKLNVTDHGQPFLSAADSEIGIAVLPLINGKLLIRHLEIHHPEFYAIRTAPKAWNFDDLLVYGPDIRFIQWDDGKVHVLDRPSGRAKPAWQPIEMQNVKVSFIWPRKHKKTPFFLAFQVPHKGYTTGLQLDGLRSGHKDRWDESDLKFQLKTENLNPDDVHPLINALFPVQAPVAAHAAQPVQLKGIFDATIDGEGTYAKGFTADLDTNVKGFKLNAPTLGTFEAPTAKAQAKLQLESNRFQWHELNLNFADVALKSEGELTNWNTAKAAYTAKLGGKLEDLNTVAKMVSAENSSGNLEKQPEKKWSGKAALAISLTGTPSESTCATEIKAEDVPIQDLLEQLPEEARPLASMLGFSKNAKLKGEVKLIPNQSIEIKEAELPLSVGTVHASGTVDFKNKETSLSFKGTELALNAVQDKLNEKFHSGKKNSAELPPGTKAKIGGAFDVTGVYTSEQKNSDTSGTVALHNAQFSLSDGSLTTKNISGDIDWNSRSIAFHKVAGGMGDGTFQLDGTIGTNEREPIALTLQAKHTQLEQLESILRMLRLQLPILTQRQLYGRVADLELKVNGNPKNPQVYLCATPEDLFYQPPGLTKPLRAKGGTIVYDKDNLTLSDLLLAVRSDKVTVGLTINNVSGVADVKDIKVQTLGVDLTEVNYYLSSVLMPVPLRKAYTEFLKQYKLASVHGRAFGDGKCQIHGNNVTLDGSITLQNVGAKVGGQKFPVERVTGTLTVKGPDLVLQTLSGSVRSSHFNLDGKITNYQDPNASWNTQTTASLEPRELVELLPAMSDELKDWHLQFRAASTLELKATVKGDNKRNDVAFQLRADPNDKLTFATPFGTLYQPNGERLTFDGAAQLTGTGIDLSNAHLLIGNSSLSTSGSIQYAFLPKGARTSERRLPAGTERSRQDGGAPEAPDTSQVDLAHSKINMQLAMGSPMPAYKLGALFDPTITKKQIQGTVDGHMTLNGTIGLPAPSGNLHAEKLSSSICDLHDVSGTISLDHSSEGEPQVGKLDIGYAQYHKLPIENFKADLTFTTSGGDRSVISINKGTADVAGGTVDLRGTYDLKDHRLSVDSTLNKVKAAVIADDLFDHPAEISGLTDGHITLSTEGIDAKTAISNLSGSGHLMVHSGNISRFGYLQAKLTQANLLHQGLFGFNLNNLLQSVYPVRTGQFKDLSSQFTMDKGILAMTELRYNGDDMRLWGSGKANLALDTIVIDIAGKIPRVTASVIGGPVGEVSRAFTLQKMMNVVTMHQLEALPSLPVLGDIAANKPRTFSFKVSAPMDNPKVLAQSIEKSFHWLPTKPGASAHPVPGLH